MHRQLQLGEQVDVLVDGLAHLGHADELPWEDTTEGHGAAASRLHTICTGPLGESADSTPGGKLFPSLSVEPRGVKGQG